MPALSGGGETATELGPHLRLTNRRCPPVRCSGLILIEAPSPADHRGLLRVPTTLVTNKEETSMRFYTQQHRDDCGIDRHARTMYVCSLEPAGATLLHRNLPASPEALLKAIAPYRDQSVIAAACMLTWDLACRLVC